MKQTDDCCPHCGGVNGFHTKEAVSFSAFFDWDSKHHESTHGNTVGRDRSNIFYCMDCGKKVIPSKPLNYEDL